MPLRLASWVIAILSVLAAFQSASVAELLARQSPDPYRIEMAVASFAPVTARVPRGAVVGYLSDLPPGDRATLAFLQAQYALAPCLLVSLPAPDPPEFAVGIFLQREKLMEKVATQGYLVQEDIGPGIVLLRRPAK